jgi:hypothetical protein
LEGQKVPAGSAHPGKEHSRLSSVMSHPWGFEMPDIAAKLEEEITRIKSRMEVVKAFVKKNLANEDARKLATTELRGLQVRLDELEKRRKNGVGS